MCGSAWCGARDAVGQSLDNPREAALIVPDYEMKLRAVRPAQSIYNFSAADELARFTAQNRLRLRGHCLAWEESNPDWLATAATNWPSMACS